MEKRSGKSILTMEHNHRWIYNCTFNPFASAFLPEFNSISYIYIILSATFSVLFMIFLDSHLQKAFCKMENVCAPCTQWFGFVLNRNQSER